ncbi:hypothetical protein OBBRIDRAFT_793859 [Obba rivulosa]|uniref:Microbial-type PARG catalytic domain-containing protein n=1 Tax=Obba rivulosa TaxID=1052685 RepID=A0A8E2DLH1_9APHY|nr:hypothetical protein OBBRIDRAFT_793859 [Obba rivulosa]
MHDISAQVELSRQGTTFYPHYSEPLAHWADERLPGRTTKTTFEFTRNTPLTTARRLSRSDPHLWTHDPFSLARTRLGVLSFASPKRPGGGFLHGGDEQEEAIARHSSLVASLAAPAAQDFYREHRSFKSEDGSGLHDHSMVYSPGVVVFRKDVDDTLDAHDGPPKTVPPEDSVGGDLVAPYTVNVLSSVPVNAAAVRAKHVILPSEQQFFEDGIRGAMKERMARALRVFEERGDRVVILGAFGCGTMENKVETIATIWAELLACGESELQEDGQSAQREARFKDVFEQVVFAVPGKYFERFKKAFDMRVFEEEVSRAAMSD